MQNTAAQQVYWNQSKNI